MRQVVVTKVCPATCRLVCSQQGKCPRDLSLFVFSTGEMSLGHVPATCRLVCSQQGKCPGDMSPRLVASCLLTLRHVCSSNHEHMRNLNNSFLRQWNVNRSTTLCLPCLQISLLGSIKFQCELLRTAYQQFYRQLLQ